MTNDEKAKAYDEALERAKEQIKECGDNEGRKKMIRSIFPKLRESEDDRTRNEIIAFIEATIHRGGGTPIPKEKEDKWLAYLEKQKEQKPIGGIYWHAIKKGEKLPCRAYIWNPDYEKYHDCWEGRLIPNLEKIHVGADTWYLPAKDVRDLPREGVDELPEEQKEQEHICDSAQYEEGFKTGLEIGLRKQKEQKEELVYRLNGLMQDYIKEGKDDEEKEHRLKCYQLFWDALEDTNFFEQKEQKPAWSEEDQLNLNWVIAILNGEPCDLDIQLESLISWLKSLRPQPKKGLHPGSIRKVDNPMKWMEEDEKEREQKPVAWSEDDEKIISSIRHILFEHAFENGGVDVNGDYCKDVYSQANDFLLSLRPSWKPSEEQMKALQWWAYQDDELRSLLNDLNKL